MPCIISCSGILAASSSSPGGCFVLNCHHVDPPPGFETVHENKGQSQKINKNPRNLWLHDGFSMLFPNNRSCEVINWPDFQFKTLKLSETEGYQLDQYWRSVVLWCGPSLDHPGRRVADGRILFLSDLLQQAIDFPHPRRGWGIFYPISMISMFLQVKSAIFMIFHQLWEVQVLEKKRRILIEFPHVLNVLTRLLDWNGAQIMCGLGMSLAQSSATWAVKMHPPHYHDKFQLRLRQNEKGCRNGRKLTFKHQTNLNRASPVVSSSQFFATSAVELSAAEFLWARAIQVNIFIKKECQPFVEPHFQGAKLTHITIHHWWPGTFSKLGS